MSSPIEYLLAGALDIANRVPARGRQARGASVRLEIGYGSSRRNRPDA